MSVTRMRMISKLITIFLIISIIIPNSMVLAKINNNNNGNNNINNDYYFVYEDKFNKLLIAEKTNNLEFKSIELVSKRTELSQTFDNGDGSYTKVIYITPLNDIDNNKNNYNNSNNNNKNNLNILNSIDHTCLGENNLYSTRGSKSIQPGPAAGKDAMISTSFGQGGNENFNIGADPEIWLTHDVTSTNGFYPFRYLVKFNLANLSLPQSVKILDANLQLNYYYSKTVSSGEGGTSSQMTLSAYPLTRNWVEGTGTTSSVTQDGVTWNKYDGTNSWTTAGGDYYSNYSCSGKTPTAYGLTNINITQIYKDWHNSSITNHGVIIKGDPTHIYLKEFRSSDYSIANQRPKLIVNYISSNPPEIENNITSFNIFEDDQGIYLNLDSKINPKGIFSDPDAWSFLNFFIWTGESWGGVDNGKSFESDNITVYVQSNATLNITTKANKYGKDEVIVKAIDETKNYVLHYMTINIAPVNDPPILNPINSWIKNQSNPDKDVTSFLPDGLTIISFQDFIIDFNVTGYDIDSISLFFYIENFDISGINANATEFNNLIIINSTTGNLRFKPTNNFVGNFNVNISISDGELKDWKNITFIITNVNDRAKLVSVNGVKIIDHSVSILGAIQDQKFSFKVKAYDADLEIGISNTLEFSVSSNVIEITDEGKYGSMNYNFTIIPNNDHALMGYININTTVKDNPGSKIDDWVNINISIQNVNDPPIILSVNGKIPINKEIALSTPQNQRLDINILASDPDFGMPGSLFENLLFGCNNSKLELVETGSIWVNHSFLPTNDDVKNSHLFRIHTSDGFEEDHVNLSIEVENINDPPEIKEVNFEDKSFPLENNIVNFTNSPLTTSSPNITFTIFAEDIDFDVLSNLKPLVWTQMESSVPILAYSLKPDEISNHEKLTVQIFGMEFENGYYSLNLSVTDQDSVPLSDYLIATFLVNITGRDKEDLHGPVIQIITNNYMNVTIGNEIFIEGTWFDPDGDDIFMLVEILFPDGFNQEFRHILYNKSEYNELNDTMKKVAFEYINIDSDGTFEYKFDTAIYYEIYYQTAQDHLEKLHLLGGLITEGEISFTFKAIDSMIGGFSSDEKTITFILNGSMSKPDNGNNTDEEGDTGEKETFDDNSGFLLFTLMIILVLIVIIVVVFLLMRKKRSSYYDNNVQISQTIVEPDNRFETSYLPNSPRRQSQPKRPPPDMPPRGQNQHPTMEPKPIITTTDTIQEYIPPPEKKDYLPYRKFE